jgi:hypothetical protein
MNMKTWMAFAGAALVLASCSLLTKRLDFGKDINLPSTQNNNAGKDAFFLSGRTAKINMSNAGIIVHNAGTQELKTATFSVSSDAFADITGLVEYKNNVKELGYDIPISSPATLTPPSGSTCPASFVLSNVTAKINVKDTLKSRDINFVISPNSVTLTKTATDCSYSLSLNLSVKLSGAELNDLIDVLSSGGDNTAKFDLSFGYDNSVVKGDLDLATGGATSYVVVGL